MKKIEIKNENAFEFIKSIPDNSIDLILTDPPYGVSRKSGFSNTKPKGTDTDRFISYSTDFGDWDKGFNINLIIEDFYRVLKDGGTCIIFYDLWKISYLKEALEEESFKQIRFIEWVKTNPVPINSKINYLTNSREIALLGVKKGKPTFNSEYDNGIYSYPIEHGNGRFHPTQKPLNLFKDLVEKHSNENDKVLDCFSGSGTTAKACQELNRYFIGCEIDSEYYERSIKRLTKI